MQDEPEQKHAKRLLKLVQEGKKCATKLYSKLSVLRTPTEGQGEKDAAKN